MEIDSESPIRPEFRAIDGISVRIARSEGDPKQPQALLLNPWPETMFAYEPSWRQLAATARLTAVDLPGFGHSEHRDALMSPRAMGKFILRIADALELEQPHVVGPDIGTSASLFAAALGPGRFRTITLGSGGAAAPVQLSGVLKQWAEAPDLEPYRRIDGRTIVAAALDTFETYKPTEQARADYLSAYAGPRFAETMQYVQAYTRDLPALGELLPAIRTPVLILAGRRDAVVPPVNAEYLSARLPVSKLAILDAGHFFWEDAAGGFASLTTSWWNEWERIHGNS